VEHLGADHPGGAVHRWELCAFNNLCKDKYIRLHKEWDFNNSPLLTTEFMEYLADVARTTGVDPSLVHWSGATRIEKEDTNAEDDVQKPHLVTGAARP
jgi:pyruvate formate lyase activating enzyme